MAALPNDPARLSFRLSGDHKDLIEQAADVSGQSVSDFALATLLRASQEMIDQHGRTVIAREDQRAFLAMLDDTTPPNEALRKAAAKYKASRG